MLSPKFLAVVYSLVNKALATKEYRQNAPEEAIKKDPTLAEKGEKNEDSGLSIKERSPEVTQEETTDLLISSKKCESRKPTETFTPCEKNQEDIEGVSSSVNENSVEEESQSRKPSEAIRDIRKKIKEKKERWFSS